MISLTSLKTYLIQLSINSTILFPYSLLKINFNVENFDPRIFSISKIIVVLYRYYIHITVTNFPLPLFRINSSNFFNTNSIFQKKSFTPVSHVDVSLFSRTKLHNMRNLWFPRYNARRALSAIYLTPMGSLIGRWAIFGVFLWQKE